jgi:glycosyltransferase involved in cell wall biosynthesis
MRILMAADVVGGVFTYALELIDRLRAHGDEVVLATMGATATVEQRQSIGRAGVEVWHERDLALEWMEDPWVQQRHAEQWLLELADDAQVDLVHLNFYGLAAARWRVPVLVVAHSDVCSWWRAVHRSDPPQSWDQYRRWVAAGLSHAAALVAPTHATLAEVTRAYRTSPATRSVIANGIASLHDSDQPVKQSFALAAGRLWDAAKNLDALTTAADRLPRATIALAGDTGGNDTGHCRTLGPLDPTLLREVRRRAAVFVSPARYEPFGLAILEAARDHCALVLGDIPSLQELWDGAAVFVDPEDPEALAAAITSLLSSAARAERFGARAHLRSLDFGAERMAIAYHELYGRLAGRTEAA